MRKNCPKCGKFMRISFERYANWECNNCGTLTDYAGRIVEKKERDDDIVNVVGCLVFDKEWRFIGTVDESKIGGVLNDIHCEK